MKKRLTAVFMVLAMLMTLAPLQMASAAVWKDVGSFTELKAALENATDTHIRFTGDITLEKKTVTINPSKAELVIDGGGYTLTTAESGDVSYTLRMTSKKTLKNITVQNMYIIGYNAHGIVHIPDSTTYSDVTLTYDNVRYIGAQLAEAMKSTLVLRNVDVTLVPLRGIHPSEVAAVLNVRLEGNVDIIKDAPGCKMELFHIHGKGGGLTVASGAVVNVEDNVGIGKPKDYGFIKFPYADCYIKFEDDSTFSYVGNNVFQKGEEIRDIYIGKRAEVNILTNGNFYAENGLFAVSGLMTIDEDATVNLIGNGNTVDKPVIWLDSTAELRINSPEEVLIYNSYSKSSKSGLVVRADGSKNKTVSFNGIYKLEFWSMNTSPYNNLAAPSKAWTNIDGSLFSVALTQKKTETTAVVTTDYNGTAPLTTATAALGNINVIRVNGGVNTAAKVNVGGTITWDDSGQGPSHRPAQVEIALYRNGDPLDEQFVSSSAGSYEFTGLTKFNPDGSGEYVYTIVERDITFYHIQIDGYNIVNILNV